jgi:hypothetical protein
MARTQSIATIIICLLAAASCTDSESNKDAKPPAPSADGSHARPVFPKKLPDARIDGKRFSDYQAVVKFHEGSGVRVSDDKWIASQQAYSGYDRNALDALGIEPDSIMRDVAVANTAAVRVSASIAPMIPPSPDLDLNTLRREAQAGSGRSSPILAYILSYS